MAFAHVGNRRNRTLERALAASNHNIPQQAIQVTHSLEESASSSSDPLSVITHHWHMERSLTTNFSGDVLSPLFCLSPILLLFLASQRIWPQHTTTVHSGVHSGYLRLDFLHVSPMKRPTFRATLGTAWSCSSTASIRWRRACGPCAQRMQALQEMRVVSLKSAEELGVCIV